MQAIEAEEEGKEADVSNLPLGISQNALKILQSNILNRRSRLRRLFTINKEKSSNSLKLKLKVRIEDRKSPEKRIETFSSLKKMINEYKIKRLHK